MGLNKILLIGNVGSDPEMRYTPNGDAVADFRLAVNRVYNTRDGERREETEWFTVTAWGRLAEQVNQYIVKGRRTYVEGRLKSRAFLGSDGQPRVANEVVAAQILFLDRVGAQAPEGTPQPSGAAAAVGDNKGDSQSEVEDLPW
ncbi:MAG: single-stranded DNA-binding protein [Chloroflexi bacterium]|nr:single-stranded DNA-binding protein [Chloroflexota bacterium]